ncbi:MAG: hypothetical protein WCL32_16885 [Planctomycetota bacterium]
MTIDDILWPEDRVQHIARHGVTPEEVEQVCFGKPLVRRAKSEGENPLYYVQGQTEAGRYLFCVLIRFADGSGYPVTAREMTEREKRRYRQWKKR